MIRGSAGTIYLASGTCLRMKYIPSAGVWSVKINARWRNRIVDWHCIALEFYRNEEVLVETVSECLANVDSAGSVSEVEIATPEVIVQVEF